MNKDIQNCISYSTSSEETLCLECKNGMYLKTKNNCETRPKNIPNCFQLNPTGNICDTCSPSYYKSSDESTCYPEIEDCLEHEEINGELKCKRCINTYYKADDGLSCKKGNLSLNCDYFISYTDCLQCKNGYFLKVDNTCEEHQ